MTADYAELADTDMQIVAPGTHFGALMMQQQQQQQQAADARVREEAAKGETRSHRWCIAGACIGGLLAAVIALTVFLLLPDEPAVRQLVVTTPDEAVRLQFEDGKLVGKVPVDILASHAGSLKVHVRASCNGTGEVAAETATSYYAFRPDLLVADEQCDEPVDCSLLAAGQLVCAGALQNTSLYENVLAEKCGLVGAVESVTEVGDGRWAFSVNATGMHSTDNLKQVFAAGRFVVDTSVPADEAPGDAAAAATGGRAAEAQQVSKTFAKDFEKEVSLPTSWLPDGSKAVFGVRGRVEVRAELRVVFPCDSWFRAKCYKAEGVEVTVTSPLDAHAYMQLLFARGTIAQAEGRLARVPVFKKGPAEVNVELHGRIGGAILRQGEVALSVSLGGEVQLAYSTKTNKIDTRGKPLVTHKLPSLDDAPSIGLTVGLTPKVLVGFGVLRWTFTVGVGFPVDLEGAAHLSERRCELSWGVACVPQLGWADDEPLATTTLQLYHDEIFNGRCPGM